MISRNIKEINTFFESSRKTKPLWLFITGVSGSGKTYLTEQLENRLNSKYVETAYFDSIGIPNIKEMVKEYNSEEKWQEVATYKWIEKLNTIKNKKTYNIRRSI